MVNLRPCNHEYWSNKGKFEFMGSKIANPSILSSESSFSKFILETALDNLYADLTNLRIIEQNIILICKERIENKSINQKWEDAKKIHIDELGNWYGPETSKQLELYEESLRKLGEESISKALGDNPHPGKKMIREKLWKISIGKSNYVHDESRYSLNPEWERQYKALKDRYGDK